MTAVQGSRNERAAVLTLLFALLAALSYSSSAFAQPAANSPPAVSQMARQAENDLQHQKPEDAAAIYRRLPEADPNNIGARSNLGLAYCLQGDYAQASGEFRIALRSKPELWNIVALCGLSEAESGQNSDAVANLSRALEKVQDPSLRMAAGKQLFSILMGAGDYHRAARVIDQLQEIDPRNIDVLYAAHQVYALLANQAFLSLARQQPDSARMYQLQGDELAQVGNIPGAIVAYRLAIERDPHLSGVHFALGEALRRSHSPAEQAQAEGEYRKALADNPWDERAECRLGSIELQRSNLQRASRDFQRALQLQPGDPDANEGLGMVLMASGSKREAVIYLRRAVQADPNDEAAYYHLSLASRDAGDMDAAARDMAEFRHLKAIRDQMERNFSSLQNQASKLDHHRNAASPDDPRRKPPGNQQQQPPNS